MIARYLYIFNTFLLRLQSCTGPGWCTEDHIIVLSQKLYQRLCSWLELWNHLICSLWSRPPILTPESRQICEGQSCSTWCGSILICLTGASPNDQHQDKLVSSVWRIVILWLIKLNLAAWLYWSADLAVEQLVPQMTRSAAGAKPGTAQWMYLKLCFVSHVSMV